MTTTKAPKTNALATFSAEMHRSVRYANGTLECFECDGTRVNAHGRPCGSCGGTGKAKQPARDADCGVIDLVSGFHCLCDQLGDIEARGGLHLLPPTAQAIVHAFRSKLGPELARIVALAKLLEDAIDEAPDAFFDVEAPQRSNDIVAPCEGSIVDAWVEEACATAKPAAVRRVAPLLLPAHEEAVK